ncbi:MAG: host attachment protein [Gammaproteobacteria bacterium]|nr:host attachment protein [Gammaproteobacteria bacterium]
MSSLIVVADSTLARIFSSESASSPLQEIETMAHPEGRLHDRDITSDLPGKVKGSDGSGGHAFQAETDPKKHELSEFARRVAGYLNSLTKTNKLEHLLIVAAPALLGELRPQLTKETTKKIVFELNKSLTHSTPEEIREHLPEYLTH